MHSDAFRRMWSTTFRGAIECGTMFITEISLNKTIQYNVKLLASRCFFITSNIRFLNTPVYLQTLKYMTYSLHCNSVITTYIVGVLCFRLLLWGLLPWQTSIVLVYFQHKHSFSTGHINPFKRHVHNNRQQPIP